MTRCQCKSGFFSLRDCDEPIAATCTQCLRTVCARHLSPAAADMTCLDCAGRSGSQRTDDEDEGEDYDDNWVYRERDTYYRGDSDYSPVYSGRHYDDYYDDYDTRSVERTDAGSGGEVEEERAATDFGDS